MACGGVRPARPQGPLRVGPVPVTKPRRGFNRDSRARDCGGPGRDYGGAPMRGLIHHLDLTVKDDPGRWAERLGGTVLPNGSVRVARLPAPVPDLPGFTEGAWWVQDAAASLPARLLGDVSGLRVADLCAAPGGKTAQLALAGAEVTAFDISRSRLKRLRHNLERLGLEAETVEADILRHEPAELFDAILLDAPCSSTGTVRRHGTSRAGVRARSGRCGMRRSLQRSGRCSPPAPSMARGTGRSGPACACATASGCRASASCA